MIIVSVIIGLLFAALVASLVIYKDGEGIPQTIDGNTRIVLKYIGSESEILGYVAGFRKVYVKQGYANSEWHNKCYMNKLYDEKNDKTKWIELRIPGYPVDPKYYRRIPFIKKDGFSNAVYIDPEKLNDIKDAMNTILYMREGRSVWGNRTIDLSRFRSPGVYTTETDVTIMQMPNTQTMSMPSVQPMNGPTNSIFYLDYNYGDGDNGVAGSPIQPIDPDMDFNPRRDLRSRYSEQAVGRSDRGISEERTYTLEQFDSAVDDARLANTPASINCLQEILGIEQDGVYGTRTASSVNIARTRIAADPESLLRTIHRTGLVQQINLDFASLYPSMQTNIGG